MKSVLNPALCALIDGGWHVANWIYYTLQCLFETQSVVQVRNGIIPSPGSQSVVFVYIGRSKDQLTYVLKSVYLFNRRHCHLETRTERETTETS